jgi:hypothetical protein
MKKLLLAALAAFQTMIVAAQVATVSGPDGRLKVNIDVKGGKPVYAVTYDGKQMLDDSPLGFVANVGDFSQNLTFVDAKESRGIETATGILANYAATGKLPETIVISLATNERTITGSLLQNIVDVAGQDHKFILVTAYAGPQQPRESQNAALKAYADSHENVFLADWWSVAHDNWSLMYADHIHLNPEGRTTYANLIYNAVRSSNR